MNYKLVGHETERHLQKTFTHFWRSSAALNWLVA